jgi:8-oxo-dGTP diphosphatase
MRVCGICVSDNRILMVRHNMVGPENVFWSPPGGGMQFGESAPQALVREFIEETGLMVEVGDMLFVNEFIASPLHAVELFFRVKDVSGTLQTGLDPEFSEGNQIIQDVRFMDMSEIKALPENQVHSIFKECETLHDVLSISGYVGKKKNN